MPEIVTIKKLNETYDFIECSKGIAEELSDFFTFKSPGSEFHPLVKKRIWDGNIRLFSSKTHKLYSGLRSYIELFCKERDYICQYDWDNSDTEFSVAEAQRFITSLKIPKEDRDYQLKSFVTAVRSRRRTIVSPTGCHSENDIILMADSSIKKIKDVKVGDMVIGMDGLPKEVLKTFHGFDEMYDVSSKVYTRSKITVTKNHLLPLIKTLDSNKGKRIDISVENLLNKSNNFRNSYKVEYNNKKIEYSNDYDCKISPYFLGLYLGDGHTFNCALTSVDNEVVDEIYKEAKKWNLYIRKDGVTYHLVHNHNTGKKHPLLEEFRKIGLNVCARKETKIHCHTKYLPSFIFTTNSKIRFEILAGLLDSDGHLDSHGKCFEFSSKSKQLATDVYRLCLGLGLISRLKPYMFNDIEYYSVYISGNISNIPCKISRKKNYRKNTIRQTNKKSGGGGSNTPYITGINIKKSKIKEYFGIQVQDNYYITNDGMITHNSGKSLNIYFLIRYYRTKTLLIVPTINLVHQMYKDFKEYGFDSEKYCHKIFGGEDIDTNKPIIISTWQSMMDMPKEYFDDFGLVIVDECHLAQAKSIKNLMEKCTNTIYRFGFTGTLVDAPTHKLVIEGLFGSSYVVAKTHELIEQGYLSPFKIKALVLKHPDINCRILHKSTYPEEIDYLVACAARNRFIKNLAESLEGNTIILFRLVEKHGKGLYDDISKSLPDRPVYYIDGGVDGEEREDIRAIIENETNAIIIASYGTMSTGANIVNLHNIIFASPYKSLIKVLQSIGRVLRKSDTKEIATLFDIADDLVYKTHKNHTLKHFVERIKIYNTERFNYKIYKIDLK